MRKAQLKVDLAFETGRRIGISDAINAFYEQNGFSHENFNLTALMRKEYISAQNRESLCRDKLYNKFK